MSQRAVCGQCWTIARARWAIGALLAVALSGCGFHLQGASPLPQGIAAMQVNYNNNYQVGDPPLVTDLRQRLRERGLLGDSDAPAQLNINTIDNKQRVLSISPIDGLVSEFALETQVVFDYTVNGANQLSNQTLSVTRDYSLNDTQRLASESEQHDLLTAMHQELANMILLRIAQFNHRLAQQQSQSS